MKQVYIVYKIFNESCSEGYHSEIVEIYEYEQGAKEALSVLNSSRPEWKNFNYGYYEQKVK